MRWCSKEQNKAEDRQQLIETRSPNQKECGAAYPGAQVEARVSS